MKQSKEKYGNKNWEKKLLKRLRQLKTSGWCIKDTEIPVEIVDFIIQERERWEKELIKKIKKNFVDGYYDGRIYKKDNYRTLARLKDILELLKKEIEKNITGRGRGLI